jgi:4-hydroxybenzoate polyprenyltransferase
VAGFYGAAVATAGAAVALAGGGPLAFAGVAGFALHLFWQVVMIDPASTARSLRLFRSNRDAGLILFAGLSLQGWLG